tara:strand:- start:18 stop:1670 length:1653 start_codon:yes stop_codon:yes gene_type:complete
MANLKINILAQDKTKGALRSVKGGLASIKNAVFSLKGAFVTLGAAAALRGISNVASNFEDLRDSLASVTGGVKQGAAAFDFITDFALRSQFSVEQLTTSFITLKASGIDPTEKLLRVFTDTAAVTTDQLGTLDSMTRVFSRGVQGGLGLEELNQIADRGVPVFRILEEQLGITRLEIAKYGQTTEGARKILDALQKGFDKEFGGATLSKLDNLSTSSSNLGIAFRSAIDDVGQAGFSGALTKMNNTLAETLIALDPVIRTLGKGLGLVVTGVTELLEKLNRAIMVSYDLYVSLRELLNIPIKLPEIEINKGKLEETTNEVIKQKNIFQKIGEVLEKDVNKKVKNMKESFENIHKTIAEGVLQGVNQISRGIAETIVLGKSFAETLKQIAQKVMVNIIAQQIEYIALLGIQNILGIQDAKLQNEKDNNIRKQNTNLKRQIVLQAFLNALTGGNSEGFLGTSGGSMKRASGGSVQKGRPYMVGEQGAELFVPNQSGQIHQSARGGSGGSTTVNFNINAVDASGFEELLVRSRGTITQLINNAVNERGSKNLI